MLFLFVFVYIPECVCGPELLIETKCTIIVANTNQIYQNFVSLEKPVAYVFFVPRRYIQRSHTTNLRIEVSTNEDTSLKYPLLFSARQQRFLSSFEVPFQFDEDQTQITGRSKKNIFYSAGRTLCIDADDEIVEGRNVTLRVSTQSKKLHSFTVILKLTEDYQLPVDKQVEIDVSPTAPKYYGFNFGKPDLDVVKIRAISDSTNCMTISVQTPQCPIYDLEHNVRYKGKWQTMSTTAAMTVLKYGEFAKGFVVVLVAHTDNEECGRRDSSSASYNNTDNWRNSNNLLSTSIKDSRTKTIKLIITDESKVSEWIILACLFIPIFATLLTSLVVIALFRNRHQWLGQTTRENFGTGNASVTLLTSLNDTSNSEQNGTAINNENETRPLNRSSVRPSSVIQRSIPLPSASSQGKFKWKSDLYIADFGCKGYYEVKKFAKRFYWTIGIVAIFYSIPVYQLVLHYLRVLYRTGEYDICYYNYLCAQRLGVLIDFNHFWSNASYVIFGIFFIFIVRRRSRNLCLDELEKEDAESRGKPSCCCCSPGKVGQACLCTFSRICFRWDHGVPAHFGVFYALGVALTMEGFLSAAYHLCPNQSTFQFDTCFMYVIAVLLLLKIYQFRHPVHFGANHTFAILAGFVIVSVLGLLFERGTDNAKLIFKCIFLPFQYTIMIFLSVYYYAVGYVRDENNELVTDWRIYQYLGQLKYHRINGDRIILPFISFSICIAVLVYSELSSMGFASYLLYILVGNVLGTTLYYVGIMKPLHGEFKNRTWVQPTLYFLAAGVIGGFSLQYFVRAPAQWELSASASRAENEDCLSGWFPFHPFYDSHDAWHFLSAAALFLAFMGLLIVDDDLITTKQSSIPVF
ncbi:SID1 transmembrane family member 1 [Orchesella cincta]|uniref:SID1 transmembrane family member 1 n=1 Tax=Orchesella cincta TaxID=48709 RepID=A0A1D2MTU4_ORCCI|nr:SID1 transmembrane family member 1 [Orchesella cincta]